MRVLFSLLLFYTLQSSLLFAATNTELLLSKKGFCDTIKISYINGHIYVPVKINNKEYKFLFDTGARDFMLDSANGNIVKEQQGSILFGGFDKRKNKTEYGFMREFQLGSVSISNYNYVVINVGMPLNCDGMLGAYRLIENGISVKINLQDSLLVLTDIKNVFDKEDGFEIPYKNKLNVQFTMSYGCSGWAMFDTGANSFMRVDKSEYYDKSASGKSGNLFMEQIEWRDIGSAARGANGLEKPNEQIFMKLKELRLGEGIFCEIPIKAAFGGTLIGSRILEYGNIIINPERKKLIYQPYASGKVVRIEKKNDDVVYSWENGNLYVSMINTNSDVYKQGLRKGFCLTEYNNYTIAGVNDYLNAKEKSSKDLTFSAKFKNETGDIIEILINR